MLTPTHVDASIQTPGLDRVTTDPLVLPLPLALSPLSSMEFDNLFPVKLARDDTITEEIKTGKVYVPSRDSFQEVKEIMSSLENIIQESESSCQSHANEGEATPSCNLTSFSTFTKGVESEPEAETDPGNNLIGVDSEGSCQSYANEGEATPPSSLTRLSTVIPETQYGSCLLENQNSDTSFIQTVMSPPTAISEAPVNQDEATPTLIKPAPLRRSDTEETMSPPPQTSTLRSWMSWHKLELGVDCETTPIGAGPSMEAGPSLATPPKPALTRIGPFEAASDDEPMDEDDNAPTLTMDPEKQIKPCFKKPQNTPKQTHWKKRRLAESKVTFKKLVKVNTGGEAELSAVAGTSGQGSNPGLQKRRQQQRVRAQAGTSGQGSNPGLQKRRQQQRVRAQANRTQKTWLLRSKTARSKTPKGKSTKPKESLPSAKTSSQQKLQRERLTPARFFLENKLDWSSWQPFIFPSSPNKSWLPSSTGHSGLVNKEPFTSLTQKVVCAGRPTIYELAIQIPKSRKRLVVFSRITNTSLLKVTLEKFLFQGQGHFVAQIDDVIRSGCRIYVRRAILNRKLVLPAGSTKIQISSAEHLRTMCRHMFDYAWNSKTKRDVVHRGVIISNSRI